jgi:hypothetical protein
LRLDRTQSVSKHDRPGKNRREEIMDALIWCRRLWLQCDLGQRLNLRLALDLSLRLRLGFSLRAQ